MALRVQALGDAGGVNSINNFARSWQRAAGFFEITPVRPGFVVDADDEGDRGVFSPSGPSSPRPGLDSAARSSSDQTVTDHEHRPTEETHLLERRLSGRRSIHDTSILDIEPSLSSPFGGSIGTSYGSLSNRVNQSSLMHAGRLFTEHQLKSAVESNQEREPDRKSVV